MSTDNEAVVIAQGDGHRVPDRYGTGLPNDLKMGDAHARRIHDPYERYGNDTPESDPC